MFKLIHIPKRINILLAELEMFFTVMQWIHFQTMLVSLLITLFKATAAGRRRIIASDTHRTKYKERIRTLLATDTINYIKELSLYPNETIFNHIQSLFSPLKSGQLE
jgi:hypothetical protein